MLEYLLWKLALKLRFQEAKFEVWAGEEERRLESVPFLAHTNHGWLIRKLVDGHPDVGDPVVSLVQRQDAGQGQDPRHAHCHASQPRRVLQVVAGLAFDEQEVK